MDWLGDDIWLTWIAIGVLLSVVELASMELVFLMFAVGAFAAAIAAGVGAPLVLCLAVFGAVSAGMLSLVRPPILRRLHSGPSLPSGQHGLVGAVGVVDEPVSGDAGQITVRGQRWLARPLDPDARFEPGEEVLVVAIEGAIARVTASHAL
ncbi:NfeD family protein [uncultured Aeromicrobium sp.]|uniref:NfeD family protein n=1 Tax=uncultured Aeromicrobium sp. TaxID=337820 RepID=UPI0025DA0574|nr:NfeD family protein [uncultured Aeromicrobium sp.]